MIAMAFVATALCGGFTVFIQLITLISPTLVLLFFSPPAFPFSTYTYPSAASPQCNHAAFQLFVQSVFFLFFLLKTAMFVIVQI